MFSKSKPAAPAPRSVGAAAATDIRSAAPKNAPPSIISGSLTITGDLDSTGDIQIDGAVEGDIRSHKVTIGEAARVHGAVIADHIRIAGAVEGEITGREVTLTATAKVMGDIYHDRLAIEAGAHMQGLCRRVEDVEDRLKAARERGEASVPSSPAAPSASTVGSDAAPEADKADGDKTGGPGSS